MIETTLGDDKFTVHVPFYAIFTPKGKIFTAANTMTCLIYPSKELAEAMIKSQILPKSPEATVRKIMVEIEILPGDETGELQDGDRIFV